jgi:hypothetical protein
MRPMFDDRLSLMGIPAEVIVLAVAVVGSVVGLIWLRRLLTIEPEVHSFRATAGRGRSWPAIVAAVVIIVLTALALLALPAILARLL